MENLQEYDLSYADEDAIVEELISDWTFFVPSVELSREVLFQNDKLGSDYFNKEYQTLCAAGEDNSDENNFVAGFQKASEILFHESGQTERPVSSEEEILFAFQAFISERIFNHLAMLSRTRYAKTGIFSLREELTTELAEKIGLGLYLHQKTPTDLRDETEKILVKLALEFQRWFIDERRGVFFPIWGAMVSVAKKNLLKEIPENLIVLEPDLK